MQKLPPIEKIYEAYGALADGRVHMQQAQAEVLSSGRDKSYTVTWQGGTYTANDNATYWQGYAGYPVLAVLLLQGRLPLQVEHLPYFAGIDWAHRNARYKANYAQMMQELLQELQAQGAPCSAISQQAQTVYESLAALKITVKRGKNRPPKAAVPSKE